MNLLKYLPLLIIPVLLVNCRNGISGKGADLYADSILEMQTKSIVQLDSFFQSLYYPEYPVDEFYRKALQSNSDFNSGMEDVNIFKQNAGLYQAGKNTCSTIDRILKTEGTGLLALYPLTYSAGGSIYQHRMDSIIKASIAQVTQQQIVFDSVLTAFLNEYGFDVIKDTTFITRTEASEK